jgi:hypothetical protein
LNKSTGRKAQGKKHELKKHGSNRIGRESKKEQERGIKTKKDIKERKN